MTQSATGTDQSVFVRRSTGLVRVAGFWDALIFNAMLSAPVGTTIAFAIFYALGAFPGTDLVTAILIAVVLDIPLCITFGLMAATMPRTGGDYLYVSRTLNPTLAVISNFASAVSALIGTAYWARTFATLSLGPTVATVGALLGNQGFVNAAGTIGNTTWTLIIGTVMMLILVGFLVSGTKNTFRMQTWLFWVAMVGIVLSVVVLATTSASTFITRFNGFAQPITHSADYYHQAIADAAKAGLSVPAGHPFWTATFPAFFTFMTFMMWNWWSCYLGGELKSAASTRRQLGTMLGALAWDGGWLILLTVLLLGVTGYPFMSAINFLANQQPAHYPLPVPPYFNFIVGVIAQNPIIVWVIAITFLCWTLPTMFTNLFMPIRVLFSWSFDRLLPEVFSRVGGPGNAPIYAILAGAAIAEVIFIWSMVAAASFFTVLTLGVLAGVVVQTMVSITAILFPYRRPDIYRPSPANVQFAGVPVIVVTGVLGIGVNALLVYLALTNPSLGIAGAFGLPGPTAGILFLASFFVIGAIIYYVARSIRRSQGIDLDLVYREIPPE